MTDHPLIKGLKALEKELGFVRIPCNSDLCSEGFWPDGGECGECDGLEYFLEKVKHVEK